MPQDTESQKDQPSLGEEYLLPHERSGKEDRDEGSVAKNLFDLLGSDPEFSGAEEPQKADESADPNQSESESEGAEQESADEESEEAATDDKSEDEEQLEEQEEALYEIAVDGETVRVTLDELQKGYSRHKDYTQKTQQLAEQRRQIESQATEASELRDAYGQRLEELDELLVKAGGPEPDWAELEKGDPAEFAAAHARWQRKQETRNRVRAEREQLRQEQAQEAQTRHAQDVAAAAQKLAEAIPEWKDETKRKAGQESVRKYANELGFTDQQLARVADHRIFLLFQKAMLHDQASTKGRKVIEQTKQKPARVLQPGKPQGHRADARKAVREKVSRLKSTGSVKDAAAVFYDLLSDTD
jgi:hypothetical protein